MPYHRKVVRHKQIGELEVVLEVVEQVDDLGLNRHVERRNRLVEHDQPRLQREGPRHPDPLPLAARELVREPVHVLLLEPDLAEQLPNLRLHVLAVRTVEAQRHPDYLPHPLAGIERRERVLEHHLHLAPQGLHLPAARLRDVLAAEAQRAVRGVDEAHDRPRHRRLPAARLADQPDGLPFCDGEGHVVDGVHLRHLALDQDALLDREEDLEVLDLDQRRAVLRTAVGGRRLRGLDAHARRLPTAWTLTPARAPSPPARSRPAAPRASSASRPRTASSGPDGPAARPPAPRAAAPSGTRRTRAGSAGGSGSPPARWPATAADRRSPAAGPAAACPPA